MLAQQAWARQPLGERLERLRQLRFALAGEVPALLDDLGRCRPGACETELLSSEILPLLDAIAFLEQEAAEWLAPRRPGRRGQPGWLKGFELEVHRDPWGTVLVIGPSNYPLFLPGVHCLQALAAGNAALWKPAPGCGSLAHRVARTWQKCGGDPELLQVLPEDPEDAQRRLALGQVQKLVLTGSRETGEAVYRQAARARVPATLELSGCDLLWVGPGADLERAARAVAFGLRLNGGRTCLAPRRILVQRELHEAFRQTLSRCLQEGPGSPARWQPTLDEATRAGGTLIHRDPWLVEFEHLPAQPPPTAFGPLAALVVVDDPESALDWLRLSPYALGASLFGSRDWARPLALRVPAGVVSVNDLIAPTADPRVPFGGRGASGFGTTRGGEGLLEMTTPRALQIRTGGIPYHLEAPHPRDRDILTGYLQLTHSRGVWRRLAGLIRLLLAAGRRRKEKPRNG